jgi:hypothetical protein
MPTNQPQKLLNLTNPSAGGSTFRDAFSTWINGAPCGSEIDIANLNFGSTTNDQTIANALKAAIDRGVTLKIVVDSGALVAGSEGADLKTYLAAHGTAASYFFECNGPTAGNAGCLSNAAGSIMHNKFALFTLTGTTPYMVYQTTANMFYQNNGEPWNNAVIYSAGSTSTGQPNSSPNTMWQTYQQYFNYLVYFSPSGDTPQPNFYGTMTAAARTSSKYDTLASFSPEAPTDNFVRDDLQSINDQVPGSGSRPGCKYPGGTGVSSRTQVNVAMAGWNGASGANEAEDLHDLATDGCKVKVVVGGKDNVDSGVVDALYAAANDTYSANGGSFTANYYCNNPDGTSPSNHLKEVLVGGGYNTETGQQVILTGSENFNDDSLRSSDNTLLQIESDAGGVYDSYLTQFNNLWGDSRLRQIGAGHYTTQELESSTLCGNAVNP